RQSSSGSCRSAPARSYKIRSWIDVVAMKKPAGAGCFEETVCCDGSGDRLDMRGEAALVARGLVLVDQATAGVTVKHRLRGLVGGFGASLVFGLDGFQHLADRRAQHRTLAGIAHVAHFGLAGALLGGLDVCHGVTPSNSREIKPVSIAARPLIVNHGRSSAGRAA